MKKVMLVILSIMLMLPVGVMAKKNTDTKYKEYETLNFGQTLIAEDIEIENEDYEENDNQAIIYMFRGQGCGYCKKFLNFLNSISEEYGEYFKLVSFEVWQNTDNATLLDEVAQAMGEEASGVPYIIIGNKVFPGYAEEYDEPIKAQIKDLYETKKEDRYDVFEHLGAKKNHDLVVGIGAVIVIAGLATVAIVTRKNNA